MTDTPRPGEQPLESWKEIAAYLNRDVRTAKRWEASEGLPVHRHHHHARASVYAFASEIDAWRAGRKTSPRPDSVRTPAVVRMVAAAVLLVAALATAGGGRVLGPIAASAGAQGSGPTPRLLFTAVGSSMADVSADGQYMLVNDASHLYLRSLASGQMTRIVEGSSEADVNDALLSPDGSQVAYRWREFASQIESGASMRFRDSIRVTGRQGGAAEVIVAPAADRAVRPGAWFPDGSGLLVTTHPENRAQVGEVMKVAADGTSASVIASFTSERWVTWPRLSPDGRSIAFDARPQAGVEQAHVFVMDADGRNERPVVQMAGVNKPLGWTEDGSHLLFASDRGGPISLWAVRWSGTEAVGIPFLVQAEVFGGMLRGGNFYYTERRSAGPIVSVVERTGAGSRATQSFGGRDASWSPDGRSIALLQRRFNGQNGFDLVIRALETGQERAYPQTLGLGQRMPRWLPSGDAVLVEAVTGPSGAGAAIYRIDLETGEFRQLYSRDAPDHTRSPAFDLSADGSRTYHAIRQGTGAWTGIVAVGLADGGEELVAQFPGEGFQGWIGLATSPDGAQVAVYSVDPHPTYTARLIVTRTDGSGLVEVSPSFESRMIPAPITWSRDGLHLIVPVAGPQGTWETRRVAVPGMATSIDSLRAESLDGVLPGQPPGAIDLSLDGSRLLVGSQSAQKAQFWVLDNLSAWLQSRP